MTETWRCFVAVPIPDKLREDLATMVATIRDEPAVADLRWTDPAGWHLTIAFLGATSSADVERIAAVLREVAGTMTPFVVPGGGLGAFPSAREARVVWYDIDDGNGRLRTLATRVHGVLGLEAPSPFRSHLTLARSRKRFDGPNLVDWLVSTESPRAEIGVDRLTLFRSHLGRGPARYEALSEAPMRRAEVVHG